MTVMSAVTMPAGGALDLPQALFFLLGQILALVVCYNENLD